MSEKNVNPIMKWFMADCHFYHHNVLQYCGRPWATVEEMNNALIKNINDCVGADDELYDLGDFTFSKDPAIWADLRSRINCKKIYKLRGNHDRKALNNPEIAKLFEWVAEAYILEVSKKKLITLAHYPHKSWLDSRYGALMCHGHEHSKSPFAGSEGLKRIDVGVDAWQYRPVSLAQIQDVLRSRTFEVPQERFPAEVLP